MKKKELVGCFSHKLKNIPFLDVYLEADCEMVTLFNKNKITKVCGWGLKETSTKARNFAESKGLAYIALEDGFVRSFDLGVNSSLALSMVVDSSGIYYDASKESDLERKIINRKNLSGENLIEALYYFDLIKKLKISKYNSSHLEIPDDISKSNYRVLVVDQTFEDISIKAGLADGDSFIFMLKQAIKEHSSAQVLVKVHPDVISGKKKGYLLSVAKALGCQVVNQNISPWALFEIVEEVYVVTSQLGFEALLAGKKVHCFGAPFFSGWGLTEDHIKVPRRNKYNRTLLQVFYAAYIEYCKYVNPYNGKIMSLEETVFLINDQREFTRKTKGKWYAIGFSKWKQSFLSSFFGSESNVEFLETRDIRKKLKKKEKLIIWGNKNISENLLDKEIQIWRMEDGFVRSVGLGVDLVPPISLVLDSRGIYFDATQSSDLEYILNYYDFDQFILKRAEAVKLKIIKNNISKYNLKGNLDKEDFLKKINRDKKVILIPGQVESDASIRYGSPIIKNNIELLRVVRLKFPDSFIIYKKHPDVVSEGRLGELRVKDAELSSLIDLQLDDVSICQIFDYVDEVHTISSLSGFEALIRGIKVTTYGMPFYAGWGLTNDMLLCPRRVKRRTINELVAATLILYPHYCDPKTKEIINIETAIDVLKIWKPSMKENLLSQAHKIIRKPY